MLFFCNGVLMTPVICFVYSSLLVVLEEMADRFKDKPALIMFRAIGGIMLTLTLLSVGDLLSNIGVVGFCIFLSGVPMVGVRLDCIVSELISEFVLFPLHVMFGNESEDDLMMLNTLRSFVC
jgi:hypothetical protein